MALPPSSDEQGALLPPPPEDDSSTDDCCNFWFCLGTSKDEQARIIQTSCSYSESDGCLHKHHRFHSSYDSFAEYNPQYHSNRTRNEDDQVNLNRNVSRGSTPAYGSMNSRQNIRDSPTIHQPTIHNNEDGEEPIA